ncbi:hypothetical protein LP416_13640 [Polaromonas sp. P2-4]|nr:hypothetical protein LP416_13640 [Polaromonas sp. P2-4]
MYFGHSYYKLRDATLTSLAFVPQGGALGAVYVTNGGIPGMRAAFYGVGAAVIGTIAMVATRDHQEHRRSQAVVGELPRQRGITVFMQSETVCVIPGGELPWLLRAPPKSWFGGSLNSIAAPLMAWFALWGRSTGTSSTGEALARRAAKRRTETACQARRLMTNARTMTAGELA